MNDTKALELKKTGKRDIRKQVSMLNSALIELASLIGHNDMRKAARDLKIPTSAAKCTAKQIPGYIGRVKEEIRRKKRG